MRAWFLQEERKEPKGLGFRIFAHGPKSSACSLDLEEEKRRKFLETVELQIGLKARVAGRRSFRVRGLRGFGFVVKVWVRVSLGFRVSRLEF